MVRTGLVENAAVRTGVSRRDVERIVVADVNAEVAVGVGGGVAGG